MLAQPRWQRLMSSTKPNMRDTVDWSKHDRFSEDTVTCACEHIYRSHAKIVRIEAQGEGFASFALIARKPCGVCGGERMKAARSDAEVCHVGGVERS